MDVENNKFKLNLMMSPHHLTSKDLQESPQKGIFSQLLVGQAPESCSKYTTNGTKKLKGLIVQKVENHCSKEYYILVLPILDGYFFLEKLFKFTLPLVSQGEG